MSDIDSTRMLVRVEQGKRRKDRYAIRIRSSRSAPAERAIELYRTTPSPDCNERVVRLLYASGAKDEAKVLLERMIDDPSSDDEHVFAQDFYARKFDGRRTGVCTQLLRAGRPVVVDEIYRGNPETGVAGVMRRNGFKVYYAENQLWHNLFGLLFGDELFESGQLHSGFDWMPQEPQFCQAVRKEHRRKARLDPGRHSAASDSQIHRQLLGAG